MIKPSTVLRTPAFQPHQSAQPLPCSVGPNVPNRTQNQARIRKLNPRFKARPLISSHLPLSSPASILFLSFHIRLNPRLRYFCLFTLQSPFFLTQSINQSYPPESVNPPPFFFNLDPQDHVMRNNKTRHSITHVAFFFWKKRKRRSIMRKERSV